MLKANTETQAWNTRKKNPGLGTQSGPSSDDFFIQNGFSFSQAKASDTPYLSVVEPGHHVQNSKSIILVGYKLIFFEGHTDG